MIQFVVKIITEVVVLMRPGVNFINILHPPFAPLFFCQKFQSQNVTREKLRKALLYEKFTLKY